MSEDYCLLVKGRKLGPYSIHQIKKMRARGDCDSLTRISIAGQEEWTPLDRFLRDAENEAQRPRQATPPELIGLADTSQIQRPFPVFTLLLLHVLTAGLHSFFWVLSRHGRLPKLRENDPSIAQAIGLCFVPFYNLYWLIFVFPRLADRTNQLASALGVGKRVPVAIGYLVAVLFVIPLAMALIGCCIMAWIYVNPTPKGDAILIFFKYPQVLTVLNIVLVLPWFAAAIQSVLNACFESQVR